jgi:hypothetical protein
MPLAPPPTIDLDLALIVQPFRHPLLSRQAEITYAVVNNTLAADATGIANRCQVAFNASFAPNMDADVTVEPPTCVLGDGTAVPHLGTATGAAIQGANIQTSPPAQVATLFRKRTGFAGKPNRGRFFVPWMTNEAQVDEAGVIQPAVVTTWQAVGANFLAGLATGLVPMCIANKVFVVGGIPPKPHVTAIHQGHLVTLLSPDSVVGTQRRRLGR